MVKREPEHDPPYSYECFDCGRRVEAAQHPVECPSCGGEMKNVSKPRL